MFVSVLWRVAPIAGMLFLRKSDAKLGVFFELCNCFLEKIIWRLMVRLLREWFCVEWWGGDLPKLLSHPKLLGLPRLLSFPKRLSFPKLLGLPRRLSHPKLLGHPKLLSLPRLLSFPREAAEPPGLLGILGRLSLLRLLRVPYFMIWVDGQGLAEMMCLGKGKGGMRCYGYCYCGSGWGWRNFL